MNKLTALIEAAKKDSISFDDGWQSNQLDGYGADILELCALLEKAEEGLSLVKAGSTPAKFIASTYLAAIKQWKEKADAIRGLA